MLSVVKPVAEQALRPAARLLKNINPNVISLFGLLFPVLFFWCVMEDQYLLALIVFIFNWIDLLDGMVARAAGKVSAFGGFLDSTIDRFADCTVIAAFGFAGIVGWNIVVPLIIVSFLISYIRSRIELAAKGRITAAVGLIERTERLVAVFVALLLYQIFPHITLGGLNLAGITLLLLTVLSVYTVGQRVAFAYQRL